MKLINKSILGLFLFGGILAASCSSEKGKIVPEDDIKTPITLSSKVDVLTRSTKQDTQIAKDGEVGVFVTKTSSAVDKHYENVKLTADGFGKFSYAESMYYPVNNENVDIYGYHPYSADVLLENTYDFTITPDQSDEKNFLTSDLLWAKETDISRSKNAVNLSFAHKLSKINFTIKEGAGVSLDNLTDVEVLNVETGVSMNLLTGNFSPLSLVSADVKAYGVKGTVGEETQVTGIAAIVVPQSLTAGHRLFKIVLNGGTSNEVVYYYTPDNDVTFDSGKKYNYVLTINHGGIEVTSSIVDWVDGGTTEGDGEME